VLFSLPPRGEQALAALRKFRVADVSDQFVTLRMIFSALILYMPEDAGAIVALSGFSAAAGPPPPPGTTADKLRRRLQVRLPAPLSLRLNRLIELAIEDSGQRCSRTAVVVSLMQQARRRDEHTLWRQRFTSTLSEPAIRALPQVDQGQPELVLRMQRPRPGPRPQEPLAARRR